MREQKYKDIIKDEETEALSMTRELKFKDIQEQLDDDKTSTKEEKKDFQKSKELSKSKNSDYEDIYLTTSFKPLKKRFKLKKVFKVFFFLLLIVGILASITYFIALPMYKKYNDSKPKMIFDYTIDYIGEKLTNIIENIYYEEDTIYSDINFNIDTNMEGLDILKNYTYGYQTGINPHKKIYENLVYVKEGNEKHGLHYIEKENNTYFHLSNSENYLELEKDKDNANELYNFYKKYLKDLSADKEEMIYLFNHELDIFKEILEEDLITSNKDELEILTNTKIVTRNSFTIDKKEAERLGKKYYELMSKDEKLIEILAEMEDQTEEEYLAQLEEDLKEEYEENYKFIINIYTTNGTEFVGFDIEENGFRRVYFYKDDEGFTFYANLKENDECLTGDDCVVSNRMIVELNGRKKEGITEIEVKYNNITYATLEVKSFSKEKIAFDYDIKINDSNITGDFILDLQEEAKEYNIEFSVKIDEAYVRLKLFLGFKNPEQFGQVNEEKILKYTDETFEKEWNDFGDYLEEKDLADGYTFWYTLNYHPEEILKSFIPSTPDATPETDAPETSAGEEQSESNSQEKIPSI